MTTKPLWYNLDMDPNQPPASPQPQQRTNNPLEVMQPGEQVVCEIERHPIGLVGVYGVTAVISGVFIAIAILTPYYASFLTGQQKLGVVLACGLSIIITLLVTYISVFIYRANRWVVTSDSVTQLTQTGLFNKASSQLSLANLEDVTVDQDGILQTLFDYGNLIVESAGEHAKFVFSFCPNPHDYARKIIAAHEAYIETQPEEMRAFNRPLAAVQSFNQPGSAPTPPGGSQPPAGQPQL